VKINSKIINLSNLELRAAILSHGWYALKPYRASTKPLSLLTAFDIPEGTGAFEITYAKNKCKMNVIAGTINICAVVAEHCLSLDFDLCRISEIAKKNDKWTWVVENHVGRFLRSPSLYEDCCKAILSTNTTFQRTAVMTAQLVDKHGLKILNLRAFPSPKRLLRSTEGQLRSSIGCGYRARYLINVAEAALDNPDLFLGFGYKNLTNEEFANRLYKIKGLGHVSVNYISMLYSKPNDFAVDSYVKRRIAELWGRPKVDNLDYLRRRYKRFGSYAPIIFWAELTKHWHNRDSDSSNTEW
jgi:3-methyladenine DNA glycosylase/8-oxoguanine DNA glycosylase